MIPDMSNITTEEILKDRMDAIDDIIVCRMAMLRGVEVRNGIDTEWRMNRNLEQIKNMDIELTRRHVSINGGPE